MADAGEEMITGLGGFVGKIKIWTQRLQTYVSLINFFMIFYIFIGDNQWFDWYEWLIIIVVVSSVVLFVDVRFIMPNSLGYQWDKNKSFVRLEKKVDRLLEEQR